jgi:hypothetical protein
MSPRDEEAGEEIRKLLGYLKGNQGRVKYGLLHRKGYPIGSGGTESAKIHQPCAAEALWSLVVCGASKRDAALL